MIFAIDASAPVSGSDAARWTVSGTFTVTASVALDAVPPPVPTPPHAATTNAATSAIAESFRMFILPPECSWTARLCAGSRQALRTFAPVKRAGRPYAPDRRAPPVRADHPKVGPSAEQAAECARRPEVDAGE